MKALFSCFVLLVFAVFCGAWEGSELGAHAWKAGVPAAARQRLNPVASDPEAPLAGEKLFRQHCASCHGKNAEGHGKKPSLRTDNVRLAEPGELEWLLRNGIMRHGMPSWSTLPEVQRWQIVSFLKDPTPPKEK